jgi:hypothetical protein
LIIRLSQPTHRERGKEKEEEKKKKKEEVEEERRKVGYLFD